jgi:hypothetical protein
MPFPVKKKASEESPAEEEMNEAPEAGEAKKPCAKCKKKGKKCSGDCGCSGAAGKGKMDGALTPQEYLDACDLGIQRRSAAYVRARLDAMKGGTKCGNGYIGRGKKCRINQGRLASKAPTGGTRKATAGKWLGRAASAGGLISSGMSIGSLLKGDFRKTNRYTAAAAGFHALGGAANKLEASGTADKRKASDLRSQGNVKLYQGALLGGLALLQSGDLQRVGGIPRDVATGFKRAQSKRTKLNTMTNEQYQAAKVATGRTTSGFRENARKGAARAWNRARSRNTTARSLTAGLLRGRS